MRRPIVYEPKTALELEQLAVRLLETIARRDSKAQGNIKYLASELLDVFNDGYNAAIIDIGDL